jgi:tetrahydromethanopterin S-methyltransferase subunit A
VNILGEIIGDFCKVILPIPEEYYLGTFNSSIAVCTLSSINLLNKFTNSEILNHISIASRLLSENKGIDTIIEYVNNNQKINTIIICGKEVWGHKAGHSLFQLHQNGIDKNNKIINSTSPDPFLNVSKSKIQYFQNNVNLVNMIDEIDFEVISNKIKTF